MENEKIITYEEKIKQMVIEKIRSEYYSFIGELRKDRPEIIIERAYEVVCKGEMIYLFENKLLDISECKALLKKDCILDQCYSDWLKSDGNLNEILGYSVDNSIEKIVKNFKEKINDKSER